MEIEGASAAEVRNMSSKPVVAIASNYTEGYQQAKKIFERDLAGGEPG
jgi:hypothetical protein